MTSADQVARLLALVPYLQSHPDAELTPTAEVFGVTTKQLIADLEVLWYCGLPGGLPGDLIEVDMDAVQAEGRIRLTNAEYLSRPLRFTLAEATSLIMALRAIRELAGEGVAAAVDSVLAKLEGLTGGAAGRLGFSVAAGEPTIRDVLVRGIDEGTALQLSYDGQTRAQTTEPVVDPARLYTQDGVAYLQAWSREREAWRTFRLDRIADVRPAGPAKDHGDPPLIEADWLARRPDAVLVRLDLAERARWVAEYYPVRSITSVPGGIQVELLVADPAWLRSLLLRLGPAVRGVEPAELAELAVAPAAEALAAYQRLPPCARVVR